MAKKYEQPKVTTVGIDFQLAEALRKVGRSEDRSLKSILGLLIKNELKARGWNLATLTPPVESKMDNQL